MTRLTLPRCPYSDLERISCACPNCETFTMTDTEKALRSGVHHIRDLEQAAGRPLPQYRIHTRTNPAPWQFDTGLAANPNIIDCHHPHDTGICDTCWHQLDICLGDIPALVQDLNTAIAKDVRFAPHGHRKGDLERPDEAPIMVNLGATGALRRLAQALGTPAPDNGWTIGQAIVARSRRLLANPDLRLADGIADLARQISQAVIHAHKVIDRPSDRWFYGACPRCHTDIYDERGIDEVHCTDCGYTARMTVHHQAMLDERDDEKLTIDELVGVFTKAGQPITRQQIKNLVTRRGLPRERQAKPRWVQDRWGNMRIETSEVWVHRIGDVRDLLDEHRLEAG